MKPARTVISAMGIAIAAGLVAGFGAILLLMGTAREYVAIGAVMAALSTGLVTLLIKYPRWEADI